MRRRGGGTIAYLGSTTGGIHEPFLGPYVASKAAGDGLAEVMGFELRPFGIDGVIISPGAFTQGTEHFAHAHAPCDHAVVRQCRSSFLTHWFQLPLYDECFFEHKLRQ